MNDQMENLESILTEELRIYGELARVCSEVTEKVRRCDLDGLAQVTREQNELIMAAAETEKVRRAFVRELLKSEDGFERTADGEAYSALQFIPEPYSSRLVEHGENLRAAVDELRELSRNNRSLLSYSLQLVDRAMRFIYGMPEDAATYEPSGSLVDRPRATRALLNKEA